MKNIIILVICLLAVLFGVTGCNEEKVTDSKNYSSIYDSYDVRKARDEALIKSIENTSELEAAEHRVLLAAAENNIRLAGDADIEAENYAVVDRLVKELADKLDKDNPLLIASFVNLDNLEQSSTFGRLMSEQVTSRFKQNAYTMIEMKLRTTVFIKQQSGEFLLSREISEISNRHHAKAVVVGTYAAASDKVYLTLRVVDVANSQILASCDYNLPMSRDVFKMLLKDTGKVDWL